MILTAAAWEVYHADITHRANQGKDHHGLITFDCTATVRLVWSPDCLIVDSLIQFPSIQSPTPAQRLRPPSPGPSCGRVRDVLWCSMTWNVVLTWAASHIVLKCALESFVAANLKGSQRNSYTHAASVFPSRSGEGSGFANFRLPSRELFTSVAALGIRERFRKGQVIFIEGSAASELFAVTQGLVKLAVTREDGKELVLDVIGDNDFFGEEALICPGVARHYNVISITDSEIARIDSKQISRKLRDSADMAHMFLVYALKRVKAIQEHLANCLLNPGTKRLACTLIANEERLGNPKKLSQQTLAEMIGVTRQYVNFLLRDLRRSNAHRENSVLPSRPQPVEQHSRKNSRPLNRKS